jgi:hypothetical protein
MAPAMPDGASDPWSPLRELVASLVTPDWGALLRLLPGGLMLIVLVWLAFLGRSWLRLRSGERARLGSHSRHHGGSRRWSSVPAAVRPLGLIPIGTLVAAAGLLAAPAGAVAHVPLLLAGLAISLGAVGAAMVEWERSDSAAEGQTFRPSRPAFDARARLRSLPTPVRRLGLLPLGALVAGAGLVILPAGDGASVASLPLLLIGLVVILATMAVSVRDWEQLDPR